MAKLYPPVIAGTIPAFSGTSLEVPFSMNRAVSTAEVSGLILKIKKVNGSVIGTVSTNDLTSPAKFSVAGLPLVQGEYYKVQLAYVNVANEEIGYFSTVGVVKYTSKPTVFIEGLNTSASNNHNYIYTGVYRQAEYNEEIQGYLTKDYDTSEKLYSSRFYIYDANYTVIEDSGEILHNATNDINAYEASDTFEYYYDFDINSVHYIQYEVITSNGMKISTPKYRISQRRLRPMSLNAHLEVKNDFDTGTIKVNLVEDSDEIASGTFLLSRASSKAPNKWEAMQEFTLRSERPSRLLYIDYTVEQGITYRYSIQQYNVHQIYSERKISDEVMADFEDLFLYDGKRQLAVRFNPKVATFKQNKLEQKTETIGNKYPFVIRNGAVDYKELSISGLISYQMDAMEQFMSKDELELPYNKHDNTRYPMRDLITDNIRAERLFKTEVLSWLNNGEIKLYRSPTEGNFIVRLMNITTSPTDTLGRMLHTFNCSAYEMGKPTYETMTSFGIISPEGESKETIRWKSINLHDLVQENLKLAKPKDYLQLNFGSNLGLDVKFPFYSFSFEGMSPGEYFLLGNSHEDSKAFYIGVTGAYQFNSDDAYNYIALPAKDMFGNFIYYEGIFTFGYKGWIKSSFDLITNVQMVDEAGQRFIGNAYSIYSGDNLINHINNIKDTILAVKYIKLQSREIKPLYYDSRPDGGSKFYFTEKDEQHGGIPYTYWELLQHVDMTSLYKIYEVRHDYYDANNEDYYLDKSWAETPEYIVDNKYFLYYDPMRAWEQGNAEFGAGYVKAFSDMDLYKVTVNNETINMYDVFSQSYHGIEQVDYLSIGPGVILDFAYQLQSSTYNFEAEDSELRSQKKNIENKRKEYFDLVKNTFNISDINMIKPMTKNSMSIIGSTYRSLKSLERQYLLDLNEVIKKYREENNLNE